VTEREPIDPAHPPDRLAIGRWVVHPALRRLDGPGGEVVQLEPKVLGGLLDLAARPGRVVKRTELLEAVWNDGEVTESTRANLAVRRAGVWRTPPVECGLLAGTYRAELLARGEIREERLALSDLRSAEEIRLFNSLRGWVRVKLTGRPSAAGRW